MSSTFLTSACLFHEAEQLFLVYLQLMYTANHNLVSFSFPLAPSVPCQGPQWECRYKVKSSSRMFWCCLWGFMWHTVYIDAWQMLHRYCCRVQRLQKVVQHFCDDDGWEMETDFCRGKQALWTPQGHWHTDKETWRGGTYPADLSVDTSV